jgi:hypothetical protein
MLVFTYVIIMLFKGKPCIHRGRELHAERVKDVYGYLCPEHGSITVF